MRFNITRRAHTVGKINPRNENHGQEKVPATDLRVKCKGTKRDLDMLIRCILPKREAQKFSDLLYRDGQLIYPDISPLIINRRPEKLDVTIWDEATNKRSSLSFKNASVKSLEAILGPQHRIEIDYTLQIEVDPDRDAARLYRLMDNDCEIEIKATQDDLFDEPDDDEGKEEEEGKQGELAGTTTDEEDDD